MATFTVTNLNDSGVDSLRQAILDANATAGADTIEFDQLLSGGTITLTSGELQITDDLTINGLGEDELTVSGNNASRVFNVDDGDSDEIEVLIDGLTIADGLAAGDFSDNRGGGISNQENLTVTNSTLSGNTARVGVGGGIYSRTGDLTVTNSTISGNTAEGDGGSGNGGAIFIQGGDLTVTNSTISGNTAQRNGGGIDTTSSAQVTDSTISGNTAQGNGGGISGRGDLTVTNSTISGNTAQRNGGGIGFSGGGLTVNNSTISGNTAAREGGGIFSSVYYLTVNNSTISGNTAQGGNAPQRYGGGISSSGGYYLTVNNSTISGNIGDGIFADNDEHIDVEVINSTISGNTDNGIEIGPLITDSRVVNSTISGNSGQGFIIFIPYGYYQQFGKPSVENTIIAGNSGSNPDIVGEFTSQGFNLIGNGDGASGFTDGVNGDQVGTSANPIDPQLGPLQDNGGPTETQALLPGSPAIDAGDPNFESPPDFDQRGPAFTRVSDGNGDSNALLDIGAFEFASDPNIIDGTSGNDLLPGTPSNDRIDGFGGNDLLLGNQDNDLLIGGGDRDRFAIAAGDGTDAISDFGGVGTGTNPSQAVIDEVDTIEFFGEGLTAENMLLTRNGPDLEIAFEGVDNTRVLLQNFELEDLDNLTTETGASVTISNILFDGQIEIEDSFDVFNANDNRTRVFNRNTVTFLNDLDNDTKGFDNSDDVINGQGGNDALEGLSGDDLLRGGPGFDRLTGHSGADQFSFSTSRAFFRRDVGIDTITDFKPAQADKIVLSKTTFTALTSDAGGSLDSSEFEAVDNFDAASTSSAFITYSTSSGSLFYNENGADDGFGQGGGFAFLEGIPTITATDFLVTG